MKRYSRATLSFSTLFGASVGALAVWWMMSADQADTPKREHPNDSSADRAERDRLVGEVSDLENKVVELERWQASRRSGDAVRGRAGSEDGALPTSSNDPDAALSDDERADLQQIRAERRARFLRRRLALSDAQQPEVQAILLDESRRLRATRAQLDTAQAPREARRASVRVVHGETEAALAEVLDPDQMAKFRALDEESAGSWRRRNRARAR